MKERRLRCLYPSTFFGLTSEIASKIRFNLFSQIHQIIFHGKGGYDYNTIYNMPVWLRKFTFSEIKKFYDEEKKQYESSTDPNQTTLIGPDGKVNAPEFAKAAQSYKGKNSYK